MTIEPYLDNAEMPGKFIRSYYMAGWTRWNRIAIGIFLRASEHRRKSCRSEAIDGSYRGLQISRIKRRELVQTPSWSFGGTPAAITSPLSFDMIRFVSSFR